MLKLDEKLLLREGEKSYRLKQNSSSLNLWRGNQIPFSFSSFNKRIKDELCVYHNWNDLSEFKGKKVYFMLLDLIP